MKTVASAGAGDVVPDAEQRRDEGGDGAEERDGDRDRETAVLEAGYQYTVDSEQLPDPVLCAEFGRPRSGSGDQQMDCRHRSLVAIYRHSRRTGQLAELNVSER